MNLKSVEKLENSKVQLEIQVEKDEFEKALEQSYRKNAGKVNVPGFRKGKAPRRMIETLYGKGFFYDDAVNIAFPDAYKSAIDESGIDPVSEPELELIDIDDNGFSFKAAVAVKPEVTLGEYKGLTADKLEVKVTDKDISEELNRLAERNSRLVSVERPAKDGDTVVIDFDGYVDGKPFEGGKSEGYNLVLGSGQFIPGFEEQLVGCETSSDVSVKVTFPEEYHEKSLAGKEAEFKVKINEIKEKELPGIDDEFAKDVSEYETLEELKKSIETEILDKRGKEADSMFEEEIIDKVIENMTVEVPDVMVENQIDRIVSDYSDRFASQGITLERYLQIMNTDLPTFRENFREAALKHVKAELALEEICKAESIEISDEELEEEFKKLSEQYNMEVSKIKELINNEGMKSDMKNMKALKFLRENTKANIIKPEDLQKKAEKKAEKKDEKKDEKKEKPAQVKKTAKTTDKKVKVKTAKPKAAENEKE